MAAATTYWFHSFHWTATLGGVARSGFGNGRVTTEAPYYTVRKMERLSADDFNRRHGTSDYVITILYFQQISKEAYEAAG